MFSKSCPETVVPWAWTNSFGRTRCSWNSRMRCRWSGRITAIRLVGDKSRGRNSSSGDTSWSRDRRSASFNPRIRTTFTSSFRSLDSRYTSSCGNYLFVRVRRVPRIETISDTTRKVSCTIVWSSISSLTPTFSFVTLTPGYVKGPIATFAGFGNRSVAWAENLIKGEIVPDRVLRTQAKESEPRFYHDQHQKATNLPGRILQQRKILKPVLQGLVNFL